MEVDVMSKLVSSSFRVVSFGLALLVLSLLLPAGALAQPAFDWAFPIEVAHISHSLARTPRRWK
jgi:hypothetical protein